MVVEGLVSWLALQGCAGATTEAPEGRGGMRGAGWRLPGAGGA